MKALLIILGCLFVARGLIANSVQIDKFVNTSTSISFSASGTNLVQSELTIIDPDGEKQVNRENFAPSSSINKAYSYKPMKIGSYYIKITVADASNNSAKDEGTIIVPNRLPETPTITLSTANTVMGESISFSVSGSDLDMNLVNLHLQVKKPRSNQFTDFSKPSNQTQTNAINRVINYEFQYQNHNSFGDYQFRVRATDAEGATTDSSILTLTPTNPEKSMEVKAQLRAEGDMEIWFNHSDLVTESINVEKFRDTP